MYLGPSNSEKKKSRKNTRAWQFSYLFQGGFHALCFFGVFFFDLKRMLLDIPAGPTCVRQKQKVAVSGPETVTGKVCFFF